MANKIQTFGDLCILETGRPISDVKATLLDNDSNNQYLADDTNLYNRCATARETDDMLFSGEYDSYFSGIGTRNPYDYEHMLIWGCTADNTPVTPPVQTTRKLNVYAQINLYDWNNNAFNDFYNTNSVATISLESDYSHIDYAVNNIETVGFDISDINMYTYTTSSYMYVDTTKTYEYLVVKINQVSEMFWQTRMPSQTSNAFTYSISISKTSSPSMTNMLFTNSCAVDSSLLGYNLMIKHSNKNNKLSNSGIDISSLESIYVFVSISAGY